MCYYFLMQTRHEHISTVYYTYTHIFIVNRHINPPSAVAVPNPSLLSTTLQTVASQVLSDHSRWFSCDVSQRSFISFVVIAGLTLVVITLGVFPPADTHKTHCFVTVPWCGTHFTIITPTNGPHGERDAVCCSVRGPCLHGAAGWRLAGWLLGSSLAQFLGKLTKHEEALFFLRHFVEHHRDVVPAALLNVKRAFFLWEPSWQPDFNNVYGWVYLQVLTVQIKILFL